MKKILIIFLTFYSVCNGSGYDLYINPPSGVKYLSFAPTIDGGFILCGEIASARVSESTNFYFARYDSTGNFMWNKQFYDTTNNYDLNQAKEIVADNNGGFIFIGSLNWNDYYEPMCYVGKIDSAGNLINHIIFSGERFASGDQIKKSFDSTFVFTYHEYEGFSHGFEWFVKIDDDLNVVWKNPHGFGRYVKHALSINPDNSIYSTLDGGLIAAYSIYYYNPSCYGINPNGTLSYNFTFGYDSLELGPKYSFDYDITRAVTGTINRGMLIAGKNDDLGNDNISLMYLGNTGDSLWTKYYGGPMNDDAFDIKLCSDSGYVITGSTGDSCFSPFTEIFLWKLDKNLDTLWTNKFRGTFHNLGSEVQLTPSGGYMIFGYSDSLTRIIKTNKNGDIISPFSLTSNQVCPVSCSGDTTKLVVNPAGVTYLWSNGQTSRSINVTAPGLYSVNVTDANGINYPLYSCYIAFTPFPSSHFDSDTIHFCDTLTAAATSSLIPGFSFQWYRNDTLIPFAIAETYKVTNTGKYSVIVLGVCGTDTAEFFAMNHSRPAKPDIYANTKLIQYGDFIHLCIGDSIKLFTTENAFSYKWIYSYDYSNYDTISGATQKEYLATSDSSWELFRVIVYNEFGCYNSSLDAELFPMYNPASNIDIYQSPANHVCPGDTIGLEVYPYYKTYLWNTGDTTQSIKITQPGNYFAIVNKGTVCESSSDTILANYFSLPPLNLDSDTIVCMGSSLNVVGGPDSLHYFYTWQDSTHDYFYPVNSSNPDTLQLFVSMEDTITTCSTSDSITVIIDNCLDVENLNSKNLKIYPNPCRSNISILGDIDKETDLMIYSIDGTKVFEQKINSVKRNVNLKWLKSGFYFVRIGNNAVSKLIVE